MTNTYKHALGQAILEKLEPEALQADTGTATDVLIASIAISMKRMADVMKELDYIEEEYRSKLGSKLPKPTGE